MLSQKMMKEFLLANANAVFPKGDYEATKAKFYEVLNQVEASSMNSTITYNQIDVIKQSAERFIENLENDELEDASRYNIKLLTKLQELVMMYEELS